MTSQQTQEGRRREQTQQRRATIRSAVQSSIDLDDEELDKALAAAQASDGRAFRELAEHLQAHPDALKSGSPNGPRALVRLLKVLSDAGHPVAPPRCAGCGKETANLPRPSAIGRICQPCDVKKYASDCSRCGRANTRIAARRPEGRICYPCYDKEHLRTEPCAQCGRDKRVVARLEGGGGLCSRCWTPPPRRCAGCERMGRVVFIGDDGPLCVNCYRRDHRRRALCGRCNRVRIVSRRGANGEPDICETCNPGITAVCSQCGRDRRGHRDDAGQWICKNCTPRIPRTCARCSRSRPVQALIPLGPVCNTCHIALHDHPAACAGCREIRVLIGRDARGLVCGPCAGNALDPRCRTCSRPGRHHTGDKCARCVLPDRIDDLLAGPDGVPNAHLESVRKLLLASEHHPHGQIAWINRSGAARLLRQLARREETVTHDYLDTLPQSQANIFLRALLVEAGVLPARNDDLERVRPWLETFLADQPDHHVRLIRPFAHWFLLRRARRAATRRRYEVQAGSHIRMKIRVTAEFLAWLDTLQLDLGSIDQSTVDRWLAEGTTRSREVRYFLAWARSHSLIKDLRVPSQARSQPEDMLDEQDRWRLLERSLHDTSAPLDTRAAAALILLYGLPLIRVRSLTADHLEQQDNGRAHLLVSARRLLLPPRLAQMLSDLAQVGHGRSRYLPTTTTRQWLFTGLVPGRPLSAQGLQVKLASFGLHTRPARNSALIALAAELPPAVLADLVGLHHVTAARWSKLAARDWHAFIAARPGLTAGNE